MTPDHTDHAELRAKLAKLRQGGIPPDEIGALIYEFGRAMFREAEPDVVTFLDHRDWRIRRNAVKVLTFDWDVSTHRDKLIDLFLHDPDEDVRAYAAAGLGFVLRDSHDPIVSRALIETIRDHAADRDLRGSAYDALRTVWSPFNVEEIRTDISATLQSSRARDKAWETAGTREEAEGVLWMWDQEVLLKINWEFVERVERSIREGNSGPGRSSTGESGPS